MGKKQKIALFHPWIKSRGGAEKVLLELMKNSKNKFDLYTWVYDKENTFPEFKKYNVNVLAPNFLKKFSRFHLLRGLFLPISLFKKIPLERYDKFLISTSGVGEFILFRNYKKGKTFSYVHTPLREATDKIIAWNMENRHKNALDRFTYLAAVEFYKIFEKLAWKKIDFAIFNSELSEERAKERNLIKNKETKVVYPPVEFSRFKKSRKKANKNFVYVSRINSPKRQDVLIEAWKKFEKKNPGHNLIIVGTPDNKKYKKKILEGAKGVKSIKIKEKVTNRELEKLVSNSLAGIFLGYQEDFGIVPLEFISAGKPLLGVDEGGYVKVIEGSPHFHKIKEKHSNKEMVKEVGISLEKFIKNKDKKTKKSKKIKLNNFVGEIDKILK